MTDPQDFRRWAHEAADWSADYLDTVARASGAGAGRARRGLSSAAFGASASWRGHGGDLRRSRPHRHAGHDALAAPALLRLFPGELKPALGCRRVRHGGARGAMHAVADLARRDRARDPGARLAAPDDRSCAKASRASSRIRPRARRSPRSSPPASARSASPATATGLRPTRRSASMPRRMCIPRSTRRCAIAGIGDANLVRIPVRGDRFAMDPDALDARDRCRSRGRFPARRRRRLHRRHQHRRLRRRRVGRRGRAPARPLPARRCRLGRKRDDLPRVPPPDARRRRRPTASSSTRTNGCSRISTARRIS